MTGGPEVPESGSPEVGTGEARQWTTPPLVRVRGRWKEDLPGTPWRWLLLPAWCAYRPAVALRGLAYDLGWRPVLRLGVPVISIGNLTAGGTGKTPLARLVAETCRAAGHAPAVLARGYRAGADGRNEEAELMGGIPVECDPDRVSGGQRALKAGATCLILDDGFQHRRLHRDLDLVVIDATRPWGGGVLPLGYAREGRAGLARVQAFALTRLHLVPAAERLAVERTLATFNRPVLRIADAEACLSALIGGGMAPPAALAGQPVLLASGLGNPLGFERSAAAHGWTVRASVRFPDHWSFDAADARRLAARAAAAGATLVVTRKDAVKLAPLWSAACVAAGVAPPAFALDVRAAVVPADRPTLAALVTSALAAVPPPSVPR